MFNLKKLLLFALLPISFALNAKVLVFDLGGVLFDTDKLQAIGNIGFGNILSYGFKAIGLHDRIFEVLNTLGHQDGSKPIALHEGKPLPDIMCKWMTGEIHGPDVIKLAMAKIEELDAKNFFVSRAEKKVIVNTINFMFDPIKLAKSRKPIKKTIKLLEECACKLDAAGNPEHQFYIISNWDKLSFDCLYPTHNGQKVFRYFDRENMVISGHIGMIKPHNCIFEHFLEKHGLKAEACVFIDDQPENIKTAQNLGFEAILHKGHRQTKKELKRLGIL